MSLIRVLTRDEQEAAIRAWLASSNQGVIKALNETFNTQRQMVTVDAVRKAIASKRLPATLLKSLDDSMAGFVQSQLRPRWLAGQLAGRKPVAAVLSGILPGAPPFSPFMQAAQQWLEKRGVQRLAGMTSTQNGALQTLLEHFIIKDPKSPAQLARLLRPVVGLTPRQARGMIAVQKRLQAAGHDASTIDRLFTREANRRQLNRAKVIARTEMSAAFNQGHLSTVETSVQEGLIDGIPSKIWLTASDERVCPLCNPLDEVKVDIKDNFPFGAGLTPPRHPSCRCTTIYEVEPAAA